VILEKLSMGIGDRFGHQGRAQLSAILEARNQGIDVVPVWNKSFREHSIIGTGPLDTRQEADKAVKALAYAGPYYVDADHINLDNCDTFLQASNFFTVDVAEAIGQSCEQAALDAFIGQASHFLGELEIPGIEASLRVTAEMLEAIARKFLGAVKEAGRIYRHIAASKTADTFVTEVSMDETDVPQSPLELFFILQALSAEGVPAQTIAPRFSGRFNKGVEYVGDPIQFAKEFYQDVAVLAYAKRQFPLPASLKLSVHSGSDKFAIYTAINKTLAQFDAGVHVKTAGTTWLEELIGLAEADGDGLVLAQEVYARAHAKSKQLCAPYASVIDIDLRKLPTPEQVSQWNSETYVASLRHDQTCAQYNPHLRQLLHVGYKIAADMGTRYLNALEQYQEPIARNVKENILNRHILPIFG
jgi:tagaturonate epimerase